MEDFPTGISGRILGRARQPRLNRAEPHKKTPRRPGRSDPHQSFRSNQWLLEAAAGAAALEELEELAAFL